MGPIDKYNRHILNGSVGEWLMPAVLKAAEPKGSEGSNPSASSNIRKLVPCIIYS